MPRSVRRRAVSALAATLVTVGVLAAAPAAQAATPSGGVMGVDASGAVDWSTVPSGTQFAYVEATWAGVPGNGATNTNFYANWQGSAAAGLMRGAYHFGAPNKTASNGASQATLFFQNGGGYSTADPTTLPPVLDLEYDSNGGCWGLSAGQSYAWIQSFVSTFTKLSGRTPVIYTSRSYWLNCLGGVSDFAKYPLWIVDVNPSSTPTLGFGGWTNWTFRQYALDQQQGSFDYNEFHGTLAQLKALGSFPRISGPDRYGTGVAASQAFSPGVGAVFVADSANYPDALAAGAAAGKSGGPVMLVPTKGALPASVTQALAYLQPKKIVIVGGTSAVGADVAKALGAYGVVSRESGADRYATSADVATKNFSAGVATAYVAMGSDWPDALSGSALAASKQGAGPMLLVAKDSVPASVVTALKALKPQKIVILGGTAVVSDSVKTSLGKYGTVSRIAGADRYETSVKIAQRLDSLNGSAPVPVFVASGANFPDALVGAPNAALTSSPLLLVPPASALPSVVKTEVQALKPSGLAIMGGVGAVTPAVQTQLKALIG